MNIINEIINNEKEYLNNTPLSNDCELSKLSSNEVHQIIIDLLLEIDPNEEWLNIYLKARSTAHIIYTNELNDEGIKKLEQILGLTGLKTLDNVCLNIDTNESFVFLNYEGNISDVVFTMHELIHYINARCDDIPNVNPMTREFPSIFYELYALNYLYKLGYSKEELRSKRIYESYQSLTMTERLGTDNINYTPYVIGDYLARCGIEQTNYDKLLLPMIKYMTENLSKTNIEEIYYLLNPNNKKLKR